MKASFRKEEEHRKRKNHHKAPSPADFMQLWTDAYVDAVTEGLTSLQQNVLSNQCHAHPQNPKLRNAEGLMTQPKKQPLVLTKPTLPATKGMVQEIGLICMLATKVVVSVFGLESVCQHGPPRQSDAK